MRRVDRVKLVLLACAVAACLLWGAAAEVTSKEPTEADTIEVIFPPDRSVLRSGNVDLICRARQGGLAVDGEPYQWEPFQPPLRVARLNLDPGHNEIQIGSQPLEVFVARTGDEPAGPAGWETYRNHPISGQGAERCATCHQTAQHGQLTRVGELKSYKACFTCHKSVEFELIHAHPLEPIEHCQMCHSLHRSRRKALLKASLEQLCADCHDS